jgi:hypothetical protein
MWCFRGFNGLVEGRLEFGARIGDGKAKVAMEL